MDTLSHGLWGGVTFGNKGKKQFWLAFLLGVAPDLLSFFPGFIGWALDGFPHWHRTLGEPPDPALIPSYIFSIYNITHSLVIWITIFILLWIYFKKPPLLFCAWLLHILCDIPTHTTRFFPTPYLWPFPTPFVNGFRWSVPWFMFTNYSILLLTSLWILYRKQKNRGLSL